MTKVMVTAGGGALESSVENGVGYAQAAVGLQDEAGYQPFTDGWAAYREAHAHLQAGRVDRSLEIFTGRAAQTGLAHVLGLCSLTSILALVGRSGEAIAIADDAMNAARAHANPGIIATAYYAYGLAYAVAAPHRALNIFREGLAYTRQHQTPFSEAIISRKAAGLETAHSDIGQALELFSASIDSFHQAGNTTLTVLFGQMAVLFDRTGRPELAATLYGAATHHPGADVAVSVVAAVDQVRSVLDVDTFDSCVRTGAAMTITEAVHYARTELSAP